VDTRPALTPGEPAALLLGHSAPHSLDRAGFESIAEALVAAQVDFGGDISADRGEEIADDIGNRLTERLPQTPHVFLDPTRRPSAAHRPANAGKPRRPGKDRADIAPCPRPERTRHARDLS